LILGVRLSIIQTLAKSSRKTVRSFGAVKVVPGRAAEWKKIFPLPLTN
jgi:hypothetical protein